jgi:hypothetical protein
LLFFYDASLLLAIITVVAPHDQEEAAATIPL